MHAYYYTQSRRRPIVLLNGTTQSQTQDSSSEIDKLLKANTTLAVWLIFFGIGGGLLALYYRRIGYLPEMEWNAALVYLFVCSVFGGVVGLVLTMSLYLPGVIWCDIIIFEKTLDNHLTYYAQYDDPSGKQTKRKEPCIKSIMYYLGLLFLGAIVLSHPFLLTRFYWAVAAAISTITFFLMRQIFRSVLKPLDKTITRQIFKYSSWFTLSVILNQISMYVFYRLANRVTDLYDFLVLAGICVSSVWISTHVVAAAHRHYSRQALVFALVAAVVLVAIGDRFNHLSMKLMNSYGIGDDVAYNLLVDEKGSKILEDLNVAKCGTRKLENVNILSKVGEHYFVRACGQRFTLPKLYVESIIKLDKPIAR
jgi:hypothetical protein